MRSALISVVLAAFSVGQAVSSPLVARQSGSGIDDTTVLNFALTLEHLENAFYKGALAKFDQAAFDKAGLPWFARRRFVEVAAHEQTHVTLLSTALGTSATKPCTYSFPYTDPKSFAALSQILEGVGTSAYTGAAQLITNKAYLTVAASILATEARHAAWVASAVDKMQPWSGPFDVPLSLNEVFSLAAGFITSCPSTNPTLPVKAFPALTIANAMSGKSAAVTSKSTNAPTFIAFFTGLDKIFVPVTNGMVEVPANLQGTVYVVGTNNGTVADDNTITSGPAILVFDF